MAAGVQPKKECRKALRNEPCTAEKLCLLHRLMRVAPDHAITRCTGCCYANHLRCRPIFIWCRQLAQQLDTSIQHLYQPAQHSIWVDHETLADAPARMQFQIVRPSWHTVGSRIAQSACRTFWLFSWISELIESYKVLMVRTELPHGSSARTSTLLRAVAKLASGQKGVRKICRSRW